MRRVLVTGATGFAGGALTRRLVERGDHVVALVRPTSHCDSLHALGVECRTADLEDPARIAAAFDGFDQVFHLAATYRVEPTDPDTFRRVNVEGTRALLESARERGVGRFVHCSTVGVQGKIDDPPADETYRVAPRDAYQRSKLAGERLALDAFRNGVSGTVVRPAAIYGPGDGRFRKLFRAIERGWFVQVGDGRTLYHMVHVDDLVEGLLLAAESENAPGEIFTLAGPEPTSIGELVRTVARALGRRPPRARVPFAPVYAASVVCQALFRAVGVSPPLHPRRVEFFRVDRAFRIDKARSRLGYAPRVAMQEGIERTARDYRERGWL